MSRLTETIPPLNFESLNGVERPEGNLLAENVKPYEWKDISAARLNLIEPAKKREFLVEGLIAAGIVGTICSRGGIGKSVLTLDLAIRIALAAEGIDTNWLCKFPVIRGGKVIILTAEDPDDDIKFRLQQLFKAIALEDAATESFIRAAVDKHIAFINHWGSSEPYALFKKERGTISPSFNYERILNTIRQERPVLVVVDTRSRFAGGAVDENSNSEVPVEVALYEAWAFLGPTVMVCHHANKSSYQAGNDNPAAFRGAAAWQDHLRFSMTLSTVKTPDGSVCVRFEFPKSNYTRPLESFHLKRLEEPKFAFAPAEGVTVDPKEAKLEADMEKVRDYVRTHPGQNQTEVMKGMKGQKGQNGKPGILSWHKSGKAIKYGLDTGELVETEGKTIALGEE